MNKKNNSNEQKIAYDEPYVQRQQQRWRQQMTYCPVVTFFYAPFYPTECAWCEKRTGERASRHSHHSKQLSFSFPWTILIVSHKHTHARETNSIYIFCTLSRRHCLRRSLFLSTRRWRIQVVQIHQSHNRKEFVSQNTVSQRAKHRPATAEHTNL